MTADTNSPEGVRDVGLRALEAIHGVLQIDPPWTVWTERGFTWTAHRLCAVVDAGPLVINSGTAVSRVTTTIPVLRDVRSADDEIVELLCDVNRLAISAAYVYSPRDREISAIFAQHVHEQTVEWRSQELAAAQIIALVQAERCAEFLAEKLGGEIATWEHPSSGQRALPDDMLNVVDQLYAPTGSEPSRFATSVEMRTVEDLVQDSDYFSAGSSAEGIAIEVAFGEKETSLIELATGELHPVLGSGMGVFITVPVTRSLIERCYLACQLNRQQFAKGEVTSALGAWTVPTTDEQSVLAHCRFVPNADYRPGLASNCALSAIGQAQWVDRFFHPNMPPRSALPAVESRLRLLDSALKRFPH